VVRGSHHGTLYDGMVFDADGSARPLWGEAGDLPPLPDIEKERAADPKAWDVVSYEMEPGDVMLFHLGCLHGGAPVNEHFSARRTLSLRFYGDNVRWGELPEDTGKLSEEARRSRASARGACPASRCGTSASNSSADSERSPHPRDLRG